MKLGGVALALVGSISLGSPAGAQSASSPQAQGPKATATTASPLSLDAAIARALEANLVISAARRRQLAAVQAVGVARERPNPEVRVEFERETPTQAYTLGVPFETGGKRGRRVAVSEAGVGVSDAEVARTTLEVRVDVRRAYFDAAGAAARLALLEELHGLAGRARDAARERFDAGGAPRLEVLQADLARADAENQVAGAQGVERAARARLAALLALPLDAGVALTTAIDAGIGAPSAAAASPTPAASAEVLVLDRMIAEQRARVALASALRVPDLTPEATITRGAEPEFSTGWRVGLGVVVPIFTRNRAAVRLEEATLAALSAERDAAVVRIDGEIAAARALVDALAQQFRRYQSDIVPQALEVERLADDSYRLGRTGIAAYLQALQSSRDVRLRMLQTAADYQAALADLERATGIPLP